MAKVWKSRCLKDSQGIVMDSRAGPAAASSTGSAAVHRLREAGPVRHQGVDLADPV